MRTRQPSGGGGAFSEAGRRVCGDWWLWRIMFGLVSKIFSCRPNNVRQLLDGGTYDEVFLLCCSG